MPTIPLIMPRPTFSNKPLPVSGPFRVNPTSACEVVKAPTNPALLAALTAGDKITVTLQRNGNTPSGPYPPQQIFTEVLSNQRIQTAATFGFIGIEICTFKSLTPNTNYILRINITDTLNTVKIISTNLSITL
jgi:hypothetical protein